MALFKDKSLEIIYVETCLLKEANLPGLLNKDEYFLELISKPKNEAALWLGDLIGTECVREITAECFWIFFSKKAPEKDLKPLKRVLQKVLKNTSERLAEAIALGGFKQFDFSVIAEQAMKSSKYLIMKGEPDTILQEELSLLPKFRSLRYEVFRLFPPSALQKMMESKINEYIGLGSQPQGF